MEEFERLEQRLLQQLKEEKSLENIQFYQGWQNQKNTVGKQPAVFLKVTPVGFSPASLDSSLQKAELTIGLWIMAPRELGGTACINAFSRVSDALLFGENGLCLQTISCGKVEYSQAAGAFRMEGQVGMTGYCRGEGA